MTIQFSFALNNIVAANAQSPLRQKMLLLLFKLNSFFLQFKAQFSDGRSKRFIIKLFFIVPVRIHFFPFFLNYALHHIAPKKLYTNKFCTSNGEGNLVTY